MFGFAGGALLRACVLAPFDPALAGRRRGALRQPLNSGVGPWGGAPNVQLASGGQGGQGRLGRAKNERAAGPGNEEQQCGTSLVGW